MKAAIIPPLQALDTMRDYALCLSDLFSHESYVDYFVQRRDNPDCFTIIDNDAHEKGVGNEDLNHLVSLIHPDEVVLPDRLFFGDDTLKKSTEAYKEYRDNYPGLKLMGVPQGRMEIEWYECLIGLLELGVDTIGVSKDCETWQGGLVERVRIVRETEALLSRHVEVHMLGLGRSPVDFMSLADLGVRGIDSAKPWVYAQAGVCLGQPMNSWPKYPGRPRDFFTHDISEVERRSAQWNIDVFVTLVEGYHGQHDLLPDKFQRIRDSFREK